MLKIAIILFLLAAVGGLIMALRIFKGRKPPAALAVIHGVVAATALVLVLLLVIGGGAHAALVYGAVILVVAALGGFFLLTFHLRGAPHPKAVVVLHAVLAVVGVACLLVAAFA